MVTKFYEDNGGGVQAVIFGDNGAVKNVIVGFEQSEWGVGELLNEAVNGFPYADEYDPAMYDGVSLEDMASDVSSENSEEIAFVTPDEIVLNVKAMGFAGKRLFGIKED